MSGPTGRSWDCSSARRGRGFFVKQRCGRLRVEASVAGHQPLGLGRLPRISLNSLGPLRRRRLRCCRSSSVADGSPILSICRAAMSEAFDAAFRLRRCTGGASPSPTSTRRRMASEREETSFRAAHLSIVAIRSGESLIAETGSRPVAGRPRFFFGRDRIELAMNWYYQNNGPRGSADFSPERPSHRFLLMFGQDRVSEPAAPETRVMLHGRSPGIYRPWPLDHCCSRRVILRRPALGRMRCRFGLRPCPPA
jgi:hypothetical protein